MILTSHRDGSEAKEVPYLRYLVSGLASNQTVIIVPVNKGFIRLAINFNCRMRSLSVNNVLFWALDSSAADTLRDYEIPVYYNPTYFSSQEWEVYHSENYIKMMAERPKFWKLVLKTGYNMLFLDVDIGIVTNPLLSLVGDADLEGQVDEKAPNVALDNYTYPQICGGAFFLKSNDRTARFLDRLEKTLNERTDNVEDDQQAINLLIHDPTVARSLNRFQKLPDGTAVPFGGFENGSDDRITVRFIPVDKYVNGHIWRGFVQTEADGRHMRLVTEGSREIITEFEPALVHINGESGKEWRLKQYFWWQLEDDLTCPL